MRIVVDNDIRLVTVLVPSNLCACDYIADSSSFIMNTSTSKCFLHHYYFMIHSVIMFVVMVSLYAQVI